MSDQENYQKVCEVDDVWEGEMDVFDVGESDGQRICEAARERFGHLLFKTVIPRNMALKNAPMAGTPIFLQDVGAFGGRCYLNLAEEVLHLK